MNSRMIFATRPSLLARWQTRHVIQQLQAAWPRLVMEELIITTRGDREQDSALPEIGGKGLFTYELEQALREGRVDAAVHSLKDLPTEETPGLVIGAILEREEARDVLVCPSGLSLEELPDGAVIGTSSHRRWGQILAYRPDFVVKPLRGNVDTRIRKVKDGEYQAIILAAAGIKRLGLQAHITQTLPFEIMLPAPGQGALAVQCRQDDRRTLHWLKAIEHAATRRDVSAERAFLSGLGGGCSLPVGAYAEAQGEETRLQGVIVALDGSRLHRMSESGSDPVQVGQAMARQALSPGWGDNVLQTAMGKAT